MHYISVKMAKIHVFSETVGKALIYDFDASKLLILLNTKLLESPFFRLFRQSLNV